MRYTIAVAVVVDAGLVLVARRPAGTHLAGTWEFPGGKVRRGEACEAALRRELREEVGLDVDTATEFHREEHRYADRSVDLRFFLCRGLCGSPCGREDQELRWVDGDALRRLCIPEANRRVVARVAGMLAGSAPS